MCALNISWLDNARNNVPQSVSLLQAVLEALKTLRSDPQAKAPEWFDALRVLTSALGSNTQPPSLSTAEWQAVQKEWAVLRESLGDELPNALKPLTLKLSELAVKTIPPSTATGLVTYPLVSFAPATTGAATLADLKFQTSASASGQATAAIDADATAPDWASQLSYKLPEADTFFRIGLQGALAASANGKAAPAWGAVGVGASAKISAHLDYGFNYASSWYTAQALAHSLDILPAPGALDQMLKACSESEFALVSLNVAGTAALKGELSAGKALVSKVAAVGDKPITLGTTLGASFSADWSLEGDYQLTVRRADGGPIVRLARQSRRSAGAAVDISAKIGIDGAQAALDPLMKEVFPTAEPLIDKLDKLSDLRQLALDAAIDALKLDAGSRWDATSQALLDLATGGSDPAQAALAKSLKDIITNAASGYLASGNAALSQAVSDISTRLAAAVPGGGAPKAKLNTALAKLSSELQQRIDAAVVKLGTDLATLADTEAEKVARAIGLGAVPQALASFSKDLQNKVNTATASLATWLRSYQAARDRIAQAIGELQTRKLALDFAYSYRRETERATMLEVQFTANTPDSQALYSAFWTGQLEQYPHLIRNCIRNGSAVQRQSLFTEALQRSGTFGFSLQVFDLLHVDASSTALDKLYVESDGTRITAARDTASFSSHVGVNGASTDTRLTVNLEMLALEGVTPPLSAEFKASGNKITDDDLEDFFNLLEEADVVSKGTGRRVDDFLFAGDAGTKSRVAQASITGTRILDRAAWNRLLSTTPSQLGDAIRAACSETLTAAVNVKAERGVMEGSVAQWLRTWCGWTGWSEVEFWATAKEAVNGKSFAEDVFNKALENDIRIPLGSREYTATLRRMWEIQRIAGGATTAWGAVGKENAYLQQLSTNPNADRKQVIDTLSSLSKTITQGLAKAFEFDIPDLQQPIKVSWRFLGLVIALSRLAAPNEPAGFLAQVETLDHGEPVARLFI